ncbi:acetylornithine deacetylase [Tropicimonas sediminicola]|uniref:Acetylornithine deacetylase n=1 Tax=Tropicimonas sediminicola TaxID=1031541 RepID=A0A239HN16_9RHOB|nr:acetylornithine deacetylase [Tropicimonas sediminicola]SNS82531.1 acetylornithine deacetylase [Tropicimonas sediminicola]
MTLPLTEAAIGILADLVAYPTVSTDPNLAMIADLATRLEDAGARVEILGDETGTKANLFATLGPDGPDGIVLSGHTDVVPADPAEWTTDPFCLHDNAGRLYARGTCDMKGFIAATIAALPAFTAAPLRRPLHFAFTHDEETGCIGARHLVSDLERRNICPGIAIIGEPTEMRIVEGHKGCHEYTTRFTGAEGHGSEPDKGVNAAEYAARFVARLLEIKAALKARGPVGNRFDPPWSTLNVGRISGGSARNVIAGAAEVEWETRPVTAEDGDFVTREMRAFCEEVLLPEMRRVAPTAEIRTEVIGEIAGLMPMDDNAARDLVAALTGDPTAHLVAFGTEAGLFQALGMSVVVCGPGSIAQAHKPDEYLETAQLDACMRMLAGLAARLR